MTGPGPLAAAAQTKPTTSQTNFPDEPNNPGSLLQDEANDSPFDPPRRSQTGAATGQDEANDSPDSLSQVEADDTPDSLFQDEANGSPDSLSQVEANESSDSLSQDEANESSDSLSQDEANESPTLFPKTKPTASTTDRLSAKMNPSIMATPRGRAALTHLRTMDRSQGGVLRRLDIPE